MRLAAVSLAALLAVTAPALAGPKVVASVVPVHGIVAAVMGDTGTPELLLEGKLSEHRATFTADQISTLGKADVVFIIGHGLEAKLAQISGSEAVNGKTFVELSEAPGVKTLPIREGGAWEAHDHDHDHGEGGEAAEAGHDHGETAEAGHDHDHDKTAEAGHDHDHDKKAEAGHDHEGVLAFDPHVWLDPENAKAMAAAVAAELSKADPANAKAYEANAAAFAASLDAVSADIAKELEPAKGKPFIVFHDAYQYFENRFGLDAAGSISDISAQAPSAERLKEVRDKLAATKAQCVFREPQYDDKVVAVVIEGSAAKSGVLDGLGADLTPGPEAYPQLLRNLASSFHACLAS
jgi:zinc transport system substrate-binding protein